MKTILRSFAALVLAASFTAFASEDFNAAWEAAEAKRAEAGKAGEPSLAVQLAAFGKLILGDQSPGQIQKGYKWYAWAQAGQVGAACSIIV